MKSIMSKIAIIAILSAGLNAAEGTIVEVKATAWDSLLITVENTSGTKEAAVISSEVTGDRLKHFIATALTAFSNGSKVNLGMSGSDRGWNSIAVTK